VTWSFRGILWLVIGRTVVEWTLQDQNDRMADLKTSLIRRIVQSPLLAGVNVLFGVIAGLLGATYHVDLIDSVPLVWLIHGFDIEYGGWNATAAWFWGFLVLFAALWSAREGLEATDRRRERLELETLIENVAPPDFLEDYERIYKLCVKWERIALQPETKNADGELRWVLDTLITLAARWDYNTGGNHDVYRANVMVDCGDKVTWDDAFCAAGHGCYGETEWPAAMVQADGGLWVDGSLATADEADGEADDEVTPLLLLYSHDEDKDINIGGAPEAFVAGEMRYVHDTADFAKRFPNGLPGNSKQHIETYYSNDEKAKSVISLPVPGDDRLVGVLNIYRDSPGIMGTQARAENFARLLAPFMVLVGRILTKVDISR